MISRDVNKREHIKRVISSCRYFLVLHKRRRFEYVSCGGELKIKPLNWCNVKAFAIFVVRG